MQFQYTYVNNLLWYFIIVIIFQYHWYELINCYHSITNYNITGGGIDYTSGPYSVNFPVGSTNASFDIKINNDRVLEEDEVFNISINSITNGHIVGIPKVAAVTIIDTNSKYFISSSIIHLYNMLVCIYSCLICYIQDKYICYTS